MSKSSISPEFKIQLCERYLSEEGSYQALAAEHGISKRTLIRWVAKYREHGAAGKFGVSKSTVHKNLVSQLPKINPELTMRARQVLNRNKAQRHIRGGEVTRKKYKGTP